MDNFLSGREHVGDQNSKAKEPSKTHEYGIEKFDKSELPDSASLEESEGESGSRVAYITEEGRVTKIVVTCACGQVTEIDCNYEA